MAVETAIRSVSNHWGFEVAPLKMKTNEEEAAEMETMAEMDNVLVAW